MDNPTTTTQPSAPKTAPRATIACNAVDAPVLPARKGFRGHAHDLGMAYATPCRGRLTAKAVA